MVNKEENKQRFISILQSINRDGMDKVINYLLTKGFFEAPASTVFHLNEPGGLAEHSLNVYDMAMMLDESLCQRKPELKDQVSNESLAICSLLHDICKTDIYRQVVKKRKNDNGVWEDYDGYETNYSNFPMGHGEKSVIMLLSLGFKLTREEMLAIRWHMGPWEINFNSYEQKSSFNAARDITPLVSIIQSADGLASNIIEGNN